MLGQGQRSLCWCLLPIVTGAAAASSSKKNRNDSQRNKYD